MINYFIIFLLGVIIGILLRDIKSKGQQSLENYKQNQELKGTTQFIESISPQERFSQADNLEDLLKEN